jgi:uncharacterized protein YaaQ
MKLIITVVDTQDGEKLVNALTDQHFKVTRINSTGGLFDPGNSTLLIGIEDEQVEPVMEMITAIASPHPGFYPDVHALSNIPATSYVEVMVGGFKAFVLDIHSFEQV